MDKINLNDLVKVRLTPKGRDITRLSGVPLPQEDVSGFGEWQLWELFKLFGPHIYNGCEVPFETEILIGR